MSNTIDNRVVRMEFDNSNFEKNVKVSMDSLEKLDSKIETTSKSGEKFQQIERASEQVTLANMASAVDNIQQRFSALGIVGMTVIQNLTDAALGFVKQIGENTIGTVFKGGFERASNIQQAKFQIEGLGHTWEEVAQNVDNAVSGTAYGLDSAAKAASQLIASGVEPAGELMGQALKGISGVAAMTNREYDDISRIFTTIAGNGRVMGMQLTQLAQSGLNVAADLAKELGISEAELRENVSKGLVDFETFARIMSEKYGEHAKDANRTWSGALANIKAAEKKIGERFWTPIMQNDGPLVQYFNSVRNNINAWKDNVFGDLAEGAGKAFGKIISGLATMNDKFRESFFGNGEGESFNGIKSKLEGLGVSWDTFQAKATEAAKKHGIDVDALVAKYGSFDKSLESGWLSGSLFSEILLDIADSAAVTTTDTEALNSKLTELQKVVNEVWRGDYGNVDTGRFEKLAALGFDAEEVQKLVDLGYGYKLTLEDISDAQLVTMGYTQEQIDGLRALAAEAAKAGTTLNEFLADPTKNMTSAQLLKGALANIGNNIKSFGSAISGAFSDVFDGAGAKLLRGFLEIFYKITEKFKATAESTENLKRSFRGLFALFDIIGQALKVVLIPLGKLLSFIPNFNGLILKGTGNLGDLLYNLDNLIKESKIFENIGNSIANVFQKIADAIKWVVNKIKDFITSFRKAEEPVKEVATVAEKAFDKTKTAAGNAADVVKDKFGDIKDGAVSTAKSISGSGIVNGVKKLGSGIAESAEKGVNSFKNLAKESDNTSEKIIKNSEKVTKEINKQEHPLLSGFANLFSGLKSYGNSFGEWSGQRLTETGEKLKETSFTMEHFKMILEAVKTGVELFVGIKFASALDNMGKFFTSLSSGIQNVLGVVPQPSILTVVANAILKISVSLLIVAAAISILSRIDTNKLWAGVSAISTLMGALSIVIIAINKLLKVYTTNIKKVKTPGGKWFEYSSGIISQFLQTSQQGTMFIKLAAALVITAAAVKIIGSIDADKIAPAATAVGILTGVLGAIVIFLEKYGNKSTNKKINGVKYFEKTSTSLGKFGWVFLSLAASVAIIASAVKDIGSLNEDECVRGMASVGIILGAFIAMLELVKSVTKKGLTQDKLAYYDSFFKNSAKLGFSVLLFAMGVKTLAKSVMMLAGLSWREWGTGLSAMGICFGSLVASVVVIDRLCKESGKISLARMAGMWIISLALLDMAIVVAALGALPWDMWGRGLGGVAICVGILVGAVIAIDKCTKQMGIFSKTNRNVILQIIVIGWTLIDLAVVVAILGVLPWDMWGRGLLGLGGCLAGLVIAIKVLNSVEKKDTNWNILIQLVAIGFVMIDLAVVVAILGVLPWDMWGRGLLGLGGCLAGLVIAIKVLEKIGKDDNTAKNMLKVVAVMLLLVVAIDLIVPALLLLSLMDWGGLAIALVGLTGVLGVFVGFCLLAKKLEPATKGIVLLSAALVGFGIAMAGIGYAIASLTAFISLLMTLTSLEVGLIGAVFGDLADAMSEGIATMVSSLAAGWIEGILGVIPKLIKDAGKALIESMIEGIKMLADNAEVITDALMRFAIGVINGIANRIGELVDAVVHLFKEFFAALDRHNIRAQDLLYETIATVTLVAALMIALGSIKLSVGPAAIAVAKIGIIIAEIMGILLAITLGFGAVASLIPGIKDVVEAGGELLMELGRAIGKFIGGLVGGVVEGFANSMPSIADDLSDFMQRLQPFLDGVRNVDDKAKEGAAMVLGIIGTILAFDFVDGINRFLGFSTDFEAIADQTDKMVDIVSKFGEEAKAIPTDTVESAKRTGEALKAITEAINSMPTEGGLKGLIFGETDVEKFSTVLLPLIDGVVEFGNRALGITDEMTAAAKNAAEIITAIAEACDSIPNSGLSLSTIIFGDNKPDEWAKQITELATGIVDFATTSTGITDEMTKAAKNTCEIISIIAETVDQIPNSGLSFASVFVGDNSPDKWGVQICILAAAIKAFGELSAQIPADAITATWNVIAIVQYLVELSQSMTALGYYEQILSIDYDYLFEKYITAVEYIKKLSDKASKISDTGFKAANDACKLLSDITKLKFNKLRLDDNFESSLESLAKGFSHFCRNLPSAVEIGIVLSFKDIILEVFEMVGNIGSTVSRVPNFDTMGESIANLAYGIYVYVNILGKTDISRLSSDAEEYTKFFNALGAVDVKWGSLLYYVLKDKDIKNLTNLSAIGDGLSKFCKSIPNKDTLQKVTDSTDELIAIFNIIKSIGDSTNGNVIDNASKIGTALGQLGSGLWSYINTLQTTDISRLNDDAAAIKTFLTKLNEIGCANGSLLLSLLTTDPDKLHLGSGLSALGNGIYDYMHALNSYTDLDRLTADATNLQNFLSSISSTTYDANSPVFKEEFATRLKDLGSAIADYCDYTSTGSDDKAAMSWRLQRDGQYLQTFLNSLGNTDMTKGALPFVFSNADPHPFATFAWGLKTLAENVELFGLEASDKGLDNIDKVLSMFSNVENFNAEAIAASDEYIAQITTAFDKLYNGTIGKFEDTDKLWGIISTWVSTIYWAISINMTNSVVPEWKRIYKEDILGVFDSVENDDAHKAISNFKDMLVTALTVDDKKLKDAGISMAKLVITGLESKDSNNNDRFYLAGLNAAQGYLNGLQNEWVQGKIIEAAYNIGDATVNSTAKALDERSPSKAMYHVGDFAGLGFINALTDRVKDAEAAGKELGNRPVDAIKATLSNLDFNDYMNLNPIIRPELDLSGILSRTDEINSLFNGNVSASGAGIQNGDNNVGARQINFTQNNYSPKALSRTEIYRQTRNQLSLAKGAL